MRYDQRLIGNTDVEHESCCRVGWPELTPPCRAEGIVQSKAVRQVPVVGVQYLTSLDTSTPWSAARPKELPCWPATRLIPRPPPIAERNVTVGLANGDEPEEAMPQVALPDTDGCTPGPNDDTTKCLRFIFWHVPVDADGLVDYAVPFDSC